MHRSSESCVTKVSHWDASPEKVGGRRGAEAPRREAGDLHGGGPTTAGALSVCDMDKAGVRADVSNGGNIGAFFLAALAGFPFWRMTGLFLCCAGNAQHPYISQAMTVWTETVSFP